MLGIELRAFCSPNLCSATVLYSLVMLVYREYAQRGEAGCMRRDALSLPARAVHSGRFLFRLKLSEWREAVGLAVPSPARHVPPSSHMRSILSGASDKVL